MEQRPTEATPNMNMHARNSSKLCKKKKPRKANVWIAIDTMKMMRLPKMSESRGRMTAEIAQPKNIVEPINPILVFSTHVRSSYSNQL